MRRPVLIAMLALGALLAGTPTAAASSHRVSIGGGLKGTKGLSASVYAVGLAHVSAFALDGLAEPAVHGWNQNLVLDPNGRMGARHVERVPLTRSGSDLAGGTAATVLSGFTNPLPVLATKAGALFVGNWATGKIYRVTRV